MALTPRTPLPVVSGAWVVSDVAITEPNPAPYANTKFIRLRNTGANTVFIQVSADLAQVPASATVEVVGVPVAGNTITINGVVLTGVNGARTSGANDFSVDGTLGVTIAAEIRAALADTANTFIQPPNIGAPLGAVRDDSPLTGNLNGRVSMFAGPAFLGTAGNALTLATNNPAAFTISGATFAGGKNQYPALGVLSANNSIALPASSEITLEIGTEAEGRTALASAAFWLVNPGSQLGIIGENSAVGSIAIHFTYIQG